MNVSERDRRALIILGIAAVVMGTIYFWPEPKVEVVGGTASNVEQAAARLQDVRQEAAQFPIREEWRRQTQADLAALEKGLIVAESLPQAQAQLLQIVRRVARSESPVVDLKGTDFGQTRPYGNDYAEVLLTVSLECQIEQLVNFMADIAGQPELLAVDELHVSAGNSKTKTVMVRMTVSGLVRSALMRSTGART